jgi:vacuole morphology and inheritance protein 14
VASVPQLDLQKQRVLCYITDAYIVQALNLILLTAGEVRELRDTLRDAAGSSSGSTNFKALYSCWSHSAGRLL